MGAKAVKVAISLPKATMSEVENLRHKLHMPRSQAIFEAVSLWLKKKRDEQQIKQYVEAYRKKPEGRDPEIQAMYKAGFSSFPKDEW